MYLERVRHGEGCPELCWIVRDMIVAGRCTGRPPLTIFQRTL
jgi:hypothetical protein